MIRSLSELLVCSVQLTLHTFPLPAGPMTSWMYRIRYLKCIRNERQPLLWQGEQETLH